ncbi:hypothetical protein HYC85_028237 [Camellia sinensis]|uniref:Retrotransposon gag domain-containing protein n=1 Tax=Camellia sinensis TaxID=4442 RepID=A0A7J7FYJ5_CAMSI|nr:hypothetical protein HYC85_028237 [Camellia sinensis]
MLRLFRGLRVAAASPASGLPNLLLCLASVCEPDSVFSVSFPEGRERSCRPSLSGRGLRFVAVGHLAPFGARFPVFRDRWPCASVRDRLTISVCPGTSVLSLGRPWKGGRLVIVAATSYLSSGASRRPTPCLPSAIPERFAGGLSCQGMTIRLTGCGLCQYGNMNPECVSTGMHVSVYEFGHQACGHYYQYLGISFTYGYQTQIWGRILGQNSVEGTLIQLCSYLFRWNQAEMLSVFSFARAELITKLQQQSGASASQQVPPPAGAPAPGETPNVQDDTDIPGGPAPPPILPQLSKTPTNLPDSPSEFEVDPTALKLSKLEKLFKKSQGVKSIPDIENGYTDAAVTLPDRFKMPHIDRFDGSGDPMVHLSLFSDVLRPMGLTRLQKLSLFGRTLSGIAVTWYAKLEDSVKQSWEEMAEAFVAQYSYNTQIEITTRDLETMRQEPKESFSEFVTRWRAKASMMTLRPTDKDQIRMIVRNLQPKLMQKMIVIPFPTFADLHEMGVQIEDAMKQGLFDQEKEQPRRAFTCSSNATTSGDAAARSSEVGMVTATAPKTTTPFTGASGSSPQGTQYPPQAKKVFTPLYMPLSKALGALIKEGHLKPLEPQPLPKNLPLTHNPADYCAFHQRAGHDTDMCFRLRHEIQDLIDNGVIPAPGPAKSIGT